MSFLKRLLGGSDGQPAERQAAPEEPEPDEGGIFAGVFVASEAAVADWAIERGITPTDWPALQFKRLSSVNLGTLESILTRVPYQDIDQKELHADFRSGSEDGPWVMRLRQQLVDALAVLDRAHSSETALAWLDTDEFRRDFPQRSSTVVGDFTDAVATLSDLARLSKQQGEPMFLLMSL